MYFLYMIYKNIPGYRLAKPLCAAISGLSL